jgi:flagellar biosynthetic protein FliQ
VEPAEILQVSRDAIYIMLKTSGPLMLVALGVGLVISLFQALTQMQEATISFVPKIVAVFLAMMLLLPFIGTTLKDFNDELMNKIVNIS